MPALSEPETGPQLREEVVLKLGDILPRVPVHLLRPGPHDGSAKVRFSVDELAEKISRGRVSVPLERLASVCPGVFRDADAFPGEQEIQLPLQKLLEQVGMIAPKAPSPNGVPGEQVAQARTQAGRIVTAATTTAELVPAPAPPATEQAPAPPPAATKSAPAPAQPAVEQAMPAVEPAPAPAHPAELEPAVAQSGGIARSISSVILSLFGRSGDAALKAPAAEGAAPPKPEPSKDGQASDPEPAKPAEAAAQPAAQPVPADCISLRVLPIFRLLSGDVPRRGALPPPADARVNLPLAGIEPQLEEGHVEVPLEEFINALPENLRGTMNAVPGVKVWIPLDEIFQSLPPDHLFYMPPLDLIPEPEASPVSEPAPAESAGEKPAPVEPADEKTEPLPAEPVNEKPEQPAAEPADEKQETPSAEPAGEKPEPAPAEPAVPPPAASAELATSPARPPAASTAEPSPPAPAEPPPVSPAEPVAVVSDDPQPAVAAEPAPAIESAPAASRSPWMRGFQVPPPRLFSAGVTPAESVAEPAPAPPPAATPEARQTVDFLASQPGVFAAAAFVEGAVFASADFPRKPDLDALRDFMGAFVERAGESGKRLGWNQILTIGCDQYHLTAVVRESHFIVALHHERMLNSSVHESLITAANDLGTPATGPADA